MDACCCPSEARNTVGQLPEQPLQRSPRRTNACPECGRTAKAVPGQTVKSLLSVSLRTVREVEYRFCRTQTCPVVYFSPDNGQVFTLEQLQERVYQKEPESDDVFVCYCFRYAVGEIRAASPQSRTAIEDDINAGIDAGQCACDLRNPQGTCCLGNVRGVTKRLEAEAIVGQGSASEVTFYEVPLTCGAAPHIGCGSRAKPVLLELEMCSDIAEAWLNRAGTLLAVVWKDASGAASRHRGIDAVLEKHGMTATEVKRDAYAKLCQEFRSRKDWLRGSEVDRLSAEEAEVIAARLVRRIGAKTPLAEAQAATLKGTFAEALKKRFHRNASSAITRDAAERVRSLTEEAERDLLNIGRSHLQETAWKALEEALALGLRPTEAERQHLQ